MKKSRAFPEKIEANYGSSFRIRKFDIHKKNGAPFWHFHPELQLVFVRGGNGKRHIGNHLSYFRNGDLILIGSNLPHYGLTDQLTKNQLEIVIQFRKDFLGDQFLSTPEMQAIRQLFRRAKYGILFTESLKYELGERLEELYELNNFDRLMKFLKILNVLAATSNYELLNASDYVIEVNLQENERMKRIYGFVRNNYQEKINMNEIAGEANMTIPAFSRYFKKHSGKTFTQFVNEFRIVHACKLLTESNRSVSSIAMESGFNNFSHFNRLFKKQLGQAPSAYRNDYKQISVSTS